MLKALSLTSYCLTSSTLPTLPMALALNITSIINVTYSHFLLLSRLVGLGRSLVTTESYPLSFDVSLPSMALPMLLAVAAPSLPAAAHFLIGRPDPHYLALLLASHATLVLSGRASCSRPKAAALLGHSSLPYATWQLFRYPGTQADALRPTPFCPAPRSQTASHSVFSEPHPSWSE